MEQQQAFQIGQFLGSVLIYIFIGLILLKVFVTIKRKLKKKNDVDFINEVSKKRHSVLDKILLAFVIVFVALILWAGFGVFSIKETTIRAPDSKGWTDTSKASFKKGILDSCGSGGVKVCTCIADYLISKYSLDELTAMQQRIKETDNPPQEFKDATNACTSN